MATLILVCPRQSRRCTGATTMCSLLTGPIEVNAALKVSAFGLERCSDTAAAVAAIYVGVTNPRRLSSSSSLMPSMKCARASGDMRFKVRRRGSTASSAQRSMTSR